MWSLVRVSLYFFVIPKSMMNNYKCVERERERERTRVHVCVHTSQRWLCSPASYCECCEMCMCVVSQNKHQTTCTLNSWRDPPKSCIVSCAMNTLTHTKTHQLCGDTLPCCSACLSPSRSYLALCLYEWSFCCEHTQFDRSSVCVCVCECVNI